MDRPSGASRSIFQKFAHLKAIQEEQRRQTAVVTPVRSQADEYNETWRSPSETAMWIDRQFDYTHEYTAVYKSDPEVDRQLEPSIPEEDETTTTNGDESSTVKPDEESKVDKETRAEMLRSLRDRRKSARVPPTVVSNGTALIGPQSAPAPSKGPTMRAAPSTCADFERTSTILQPTEATLTEFQSNVDISDLKAQYFSKYQPNKSLPIYQERDKIIGSINAYDVVVIEGLTGCGKTTQVPMYILEDAVMTRTGGRSPVIYVTQPRRIAARSIAERICSEHDWALGSLVGYQVSLEKVVGPQTVLVFCTAGVLLQKIIQEKSLTNYTHIIIDEAHERDADTDLLMMMVRRLMLTELSNFRLIIMSATMDIPKLIRYYSFRTQNGCGRMIKPSHIHASQQRVPQNIQVFYLDKLKPAFKIEERTNADSFDLAYSDLKDECLEMTVDIIVNVIPKMDNFTDATKSTLVFLPGLAEISRLDRLLKQKSEDFLEIIPLHSCLTVADQLKIFEPSKPGSRKVILATNIAESSITLTDVGFVVDFCLTKTLEKDDVTHIPTLKMSWASKDKCTQRAGRTGRCCPGKVFRMVPQDFFQLFDEYARPELLTAPLELSALRVKMFGMGDIIALLAVVLDPPARSEIRTAVLELKQIGALSATHKGELSDLDGDLTELGRIISALPIDVHLSKLIVLGSVFNVLEDCVVIAACLSTNRTVIKYQYGGGRTYLQNYETRLHWAKGSQSDLFVSLDVYNAFHELKEHRGKNPDWISKWCDTTFLDERKLRDVDAMVIELKERLKGVNIIVEQPQPNRVENLDMDFLMLKVAFCAAFYPNYFLTNEDNMDPQEILKELGSLDPARTFIIKNFPLNQVPLYKSQIVNELNEREIVNFDYIADVSRAMIVLRDSEQPENEDARKMASAIDQSSHPVLEQTTSVPRQMYMALKSCSSQCFNRIQIRQFHDEAASGRMLYYQEKRELLKHQLRPRLIPSYVKVVDNRDNGGPRANNQRLMTGTDEDYARVTDENYFYEVDLDIEQDEEDMDALAELKEMERGKNRDEYINHAIFKPGYLSLDGPSTPIQMKFRPVVLKSKSYKVDIDHQSVNSILLDPDFEKRRRQMLVAASVTKSSIRDGCLTLRDTTLMPNIRGLPSIFALLFAQYYRLVYNERLHCIAGAVCGIGWDNKDKPLDATYEVILGFDVQISPDDLELINKARHAMSELLRFTEIVNVGKPQAALQDKLRDIILTLLRRRRYPLKALDVSIIKYQNEEDDELLFSQDIHNLPSDMIEEGRARPFLPEARFTRQYPDSALFASIRGNLEDLRRIDNGESMPRGGIRCLVCGNGFRYCFTMISPLIRHLNSDEHLDKVREFEEFERRLQ